MKYFLIKHFNENKNAFYVFYIIVRLDAMNAKFSSISTVHSEMKIPQPT
jgi:hypothetical protein